MTLDEFLNKYKVGTKVDFDGMYGAQCVDLFRQYVKDVWNIPSYGNEGIGSIVGAKDLWLCNIANRDKWLNKYKRGKVGDIVVFNSTSTNKYGHVAIFLGYEGQNLRVFEQDGFSQTGTRFATWKPDNVLGFLRSKVC